MRQAPRITPSALSLGVILNPNGNHEFVVELPSAIVGMKFGRDMLDELERGIALCRTEMLMADAGPDFHRPKFKPLEAK